MIVWFWAYSAITRTRYRKQSEPFTTTQAARQWCRDAIASGLHLCH